MQHNYTIFLQKNQIIAKKLLIKKNKHFIINKKEKRKRNQMNLTEKNTEYFMKQAIKEANKAYQKLEVPVGAIIVKDGEIIARAHNQKETKTDTTKHAEIIAIQKASKKLNAWRLEDCEMYVTLEPCSMCAGAILQARIAKVYYGAKSYQDGSIESAIKLYETKGFNHYPIAQYCDKLPECSKIISNYFKSKR